MASTSSNLIAFPPDLIAAAEQYAQRENRSVGALAEEALRFYIDADPELNALRLFHKERAAELGLTPDEYVEQMSKEYRAEKRQRSA